MMLDNPAMLGNAVILHNAVMVGDDVWIALGDGNVVISLFENNYHSRKGQYN